MGRVTLCRDRMRMRTTDCCCILTGLLLLSLQCGAYHNYDVGPAVHRDLYADHQSYYNTYAEPPPTFTEPDIDRQDPATVAGLSVAMIGMAFSAAFTGAVLAPIIRMGMERMVETVRSVDIRMPVFPKDFFDQDYPEYEEYEYEDYGAEIIETKKRNRKNNKQNIKF